MGGEPTFVSIDDFVAEEWTIDADGPEKRRAGERTRRAAARRSTPRAGWSSAARASGIPGEPLPRWQIALHWRTDGKPLWPDRPCSPTRGQEHRAADRARSAKRRPDAAARRCAEAIAVGFGLPAVAGAAGVTRTRWPGWPRRSGCPQGEPVAATSTSTPDSPDARAEQLARDRWTRPSSTPTAYGAAAAPASTDGRRRLGQRRTGGCGGAGSCCCRAIRRPGCGCRWTRSRWEPPEPTRRAGSAASPRRRTAGTAAAPIPRGRRRRAGRRRRPRRWWSSSAASCLRLPAAAGGPRRLRRADRRVEAGRGRPGAAAGAGGLRAAGRSAPADADRHPRPRRHRGQRAAHLVAGPSRSS